MIANHVLSQLLLSGAVPATQRSATLSFSEHIACKTCDFYASLTGALQNFVSPCIQGRTF